MSHQDWTALVAGLSRKAIAMRLVINPGKTSMGVLFGMVMHMAVAIFEPSLSRQHVLEFSQVNLGDFICLGIFLFNLPAALGRRPLSPALLATIAFIKKAKREGYLSVAQAQLRYRHLIDSLIAQVESQ